MKRVITKQEEFEILKLVLDKFLWLGVAVMAYGLYKIITGIFWHGFGILTAGALVLVLFVWILIKEYNYVKR